jgi:hypothetical protein
VLAASAGLRDPCSHYGSCHQMERVAFASTEHRQVQKFKRHNILCGNHSMQGSLLSRTHPVFKFFHSSHAGAEPVHWVAQRTRVARKKRPRETRDCRKCLGDRAQLEMAETMGVQTISHVYRSLSLSLALSASDTYCPIRILLVRWDAAGRGVLQSFEKHVG